VAGLSPPGPQLLSLLATLGENPYIRYYAPHHHPPLGPLAMTATPGSAYTSRPAAAQTANPAPSAAPEARWKTALNVVGGGGRSEEFSGEQICRRIALQVQAYLDDYQAVNPDFPVSFRPIAVKADVWL
jgi:syntaxin-binding protein 1